MMMSHSGTRDVTVLFFARVKELTKVPSHVMTLEEDGQGLSVDAFVELLEDRWPSLKEIRGEYTLAVNREYGAVEDGVCIKGGDEVALITPVSGG